MQPQGHVQMVVNTIDHRMDPQTSLDQPRWFWWRDRATRHEPATETAIVDELSRRGHDALVWNELDAYGRGQIIWRLPSGVLIRQRPPWRWPGCGLLTAPSNIQRNG